MTERELFDWVLWAWIGLAGVVCIALFFISAPYGRHARPGWGPCMAPRLGWMLMETPSWVTLMACCAARTRPLDAVAAALCVVWVAHYMYRSLVYPLTISPTSRPVPLIVVAMGAVFNVVNAYLNGRWLFTFGPVRPVAWLWSVRFVAGMILAVAGFFLSLWSDRLLRRVREAGAREYGMVHAGLFSLVSCPNYLGEIVEWCGWAIAAWSFPALSFVVWTVANLVPRAAAHHRWYRQTFHDYPVWRRRLIPWVW